MSRIGRSPVPVPSGVKVLLDGRSVTVTGPRGTLNHQVAGDITGVKKARCSWSNGPTTRGATVHCTG